MNNNDNRIQCPTCKTTYEKTFLIGKQGHADSCPMCGASLKEEDLHPDWITWRYYKIKDSDSYALCQTLPTPEELKNLELIQEFKAPPRDASGSSMEAKKILRTYVPDAFDYDFEPPEENKARCPRCSSTDIREVTDNFGFLVGLGFSDTYRVCANCGYKF